MGNVLNAPSSPLPNDLSVGRHKNAFMYIRHLSLGLLRH